MRSAASSLNPAKEWNAEACGFKLPDNSPPSARRSRANCTTLIAGRDALCTLTASRSDYAHAVLTTHRIRRLFLGGGIIAPDFIHEESVFVTAWLERYAQMPDAVGPYRFERRPLGWPSISWTRNRKGILCQRNRYSVLIPLAIWPIGSPIACVPKASPTHELDPSQSHSPSRLQPRVRHNSADAGSGCA